DDADSDLAEEAEASQQASRLSPSDPYTHYLLAIHSTVTGRPEQAIAAAQRAIDLSPSFALGHYMLGASRMWAGRAAQAIEPLQRGLRLNPTDTQTFAWQQIVALAHYLIGEHAKALEYAEEAVASRPGSHYGLAVAACCLAGLERFEEA